MIYLTGAIITEALEHPQVGALLTPSMGNRIPEDSAWAADSGCFNRRTYVGDDRYLAWLEERQDRAGRCLFATVPDVVGDAEATLELFGELAPKVRALGYRVALVTQDGLTPETTPWDQVDALFIGGTDEHKLGPEAAALILEARRRSIYVHVGRVNSGKRFRHFAELGADSADGTFLAFGPAKNMPRLFGWLAEDKARRAAIRFPIPFGGFTPFAGIA